MWASSERLTFNAAFFVACLTAASALEAAEDETVLLQVRTELAQRNSWEPAQPQSPVQPVQLLTSRQCHDALCGNQDWAPFSGQQIFDVYVQKYDWLTGYCKLTSLPEQAPSATPTMQGACLLQGCLGENNLIKGATNYALLNPWTPGEAEYCFREHCNNTQFDLHSTTQAHAISYCDQRFGPAWRGVTVGPDGKGWEGEQPGSGLWECSRGTYHCDWAYCKTHYCNRPELLASYNQKEVMEVASQKQEEDKDAMEAYAEVAAQMAQEAAPLQLLSAAANPAQLLTAQMAMGGQPQQVQPSLLQASMLASPAQLSPVSLMAQSAQTSPLGSPAQGNLQTMAQNMEQNEMMAELAWDM